MASGTTCCLKLATLCSVLAFMIYVGGFASPFWSSFTVSADVFIVEVDGRQLSGLWTDCGCVTLVGCICFPKIYNPGWLTGVRAMLTLGLLGLLLSAMISIGIACCCGTGKIMRGFNIFCTGVSGIFIATGALVFAINNAKDFQNMFSFIKSLPLDLDTYGSLSFSFIACAIAGGLCLVVCIPLLVYDYRNPIPQGVQSVSMPLQFATQGHLSFAPPGHTYAFVNPLRQNQFGYMPLYADAQPDNIPPGQIMHVAPEYTPQTGYMQQGQVMHGAPEYTPQIQPSVSQNPHQEQDVPNISSII
ncbi:uncharacterized protein LOC128557244 [Mercenaria mercenaria]|uniref:uncharacterized protein LOC128557244 n=1 Tax=Mercenaria mercenaria TaxID=6596 RepID=UPI00234E3EFC|nr:uncharacterized protein LOC128557244 [Mercenaria mercenaria]